MSANTIIVPRSVSKRTKHLNFQTHFVDLHRTILKFHIYSQAPTVILLINFTDLLKFLININFYQSKAYS